MQQVDLVHNQDNSCVLLLFPAASKASLFKLMQCLYNVMQRRSCWGNKDLIRKNRLITYFFYFFFRLQKTQTCLVPSLDGNTNCTFRKHLRRLWKQQLFITISIKWQAMPQALLLLLFRFLCLPQQYLLHIQSPHVYHTSLATACLALLPVQNTQQM